MNPTDQVTEPASEAESEAARRRLDAFLVDNVELETLSARLSSFNMLDVLRVARAEIRHSNVLAWLLTPDSSHGLGAVFLRRFMSLLLIETDFMQVSIRPSHVELMDLSAVEVRREWHGIDILVVDRANLWCLLIENKIKARESGNQLVRYHDRVRKEFAKHQILPVYLTLEGEDPSREPARLGYAPLAYAWVVDVARRVIQQHRNRIPEDAAVFLDHYLEVLRRLTLQDEELVDLCRSIYRKHRDAIDLIVEYGASSNSQDVFLGFVKDAVDCEFVCPRGSALWFLPKVLGDVLPAVELRSKWKFLPRAVPMMCWLRHDRKRGRIIFVLEVGPATDKSLRDRILMCLKEHDFAFWEKGAFKEGSKYTRVFTIRKDLPVTDEGEPDESDEGMRSTVEQLWERFRPQVERAAEAVRTLNLLAS